MKAFDLPVVVLGVGILAFFGVEQTRTLYETAYTAMPLLVTFVKFALLATGGEIVALRIRTGSYRKPGFGVAPKMVVWGFLGLLIYAAFAIFSTGVPTLFSGLLERTSGAPWNGLLRAFLISLFMNVVFAPPMMLTHHLTDRFIESEGGRFPLRRFDIAALLEKADWQRLWGLVYKKTIPLFWIPAHTVTFLLPVQFRTAFAAILSVALGLLLGVFGKRKEMRDDT